MRRWLNKAVFDSLRPLVISFLQEVLSFMAKYTKEDGSKMTKKEKDMVAEGDQA